MTPQEKAKELVEKFEKAFNDKDEASGYGYSSNAEENALIAVDEIISFCEEITMENGGFIFKQYWKKVKAEIEAL